MSKHYRPSNGTEGEIFMARFCDQCAKDVDQTCPIIAASLAFTTDDANYPSQLIYDKKGNPACTEFEDRLAAAKKAELHKQSGIHPAKDDPDQIRLYD